MGTSSRAPPPVELKGRWGLLRPLAPQRDAPLLYRISHGEHTADTWAEMKVGPFPDETAFRAHLDELVADPSRAFYTIAGLDGAAQGWLCLMEAQPQHGSVELGYVVLAPDLRRTTLATEAFYLIMAHVFDDLAYRRLEWTCTASNARSRSAALRLGFTLEGIMRRKLVPKGVTHDIPLYSLLADEWPARKQAMLRWLSPSNFENGVQKERLAP